MASHNFMEHTGSDGSSPQQRATAAGYPSIVGENIARNMARGAEALSAWKSSHTGHNENMLRPAWHAVGIAREQSPTTGEWFWATSYGDVLDCPLSVAGAASVSAGTFSGFSSGAGAEAVGGAPVSYTHLTLPTILRV